MKRKPNKYDTVLNLKANTLPISSLCQVVPSVFKATYAIVNGSTVTHLALFTKIPCFYQQNEAILHHQFIQICNLGRKVETKYYIKGLI